MRNRTYGGVRGRKTKVGEKLLRFPPTRFVGGRTALCWRTAFVMAVLHCAGRAAKPKPEGYTPAMQLVTPRAVAMAVRIEMAV